MSGRKLSSFAYVLPLLAACETSTLAPVVRSKRKTLVPVGAFVTGPTMSAASLTYATKRPSALMLGCSPILAAPGSPTSCETSVVWPVESSRRKSAGSGPPL